MSALGEGGVMNDPQNRASSHVDRGRRLNEAGRPDLAMREFQAALAIDPESAQAFAGLALALSLLDQDERARDAALAAIGLAPEISISHVVLAISELERDQPAAASKAIDEAIRLDPLVAMYHGIRASVLLAQDQPEAALAAVDRGLAVDPADTACLEARCALLHDLDRFEEAIEQARRSLSIHPFSHFTHTHLGYTLLAKGAYAEAAEHFRSALRRKPSHPPARRGLHRALRMHLAIYRVLYRLEGRLLRRPKLMKVAAMSAAVLLLFFCLFLLPPFSQDFRDRAETAAAVIYGIGLFFLATNPVVNGLLILKRVEGLPLDHRERSWSLIALAMALTALLLGATSLFLRGHPPLAGICVRTAIALAVLIVPIHVMLRHAAGPANRRRITHVALFLSVPWLAAWVVSGADAVLFLGVICFYGIVLLLPKRTATRA